MFIETITVPRGEWERWSDRLGMLDDPPKALVATIAWNSGSGEISQVSVWDSPAAVADFFMERIRPIVEAEGEPAHQPQRHCEPVVVYLRSRS